MALRLTLPGSKTQRRPAAGYALPSMPMPMAAPVAPQMQAQQQQQPQPVSTGLDPAIVARAANKAGISEATLNKLATMIPALLDALSQANAPRDLVRDSTGRITGSVQRDMTGQTSG